MCGAARAWLEQIYQGLFLAPGLDAGPPCRFIWPVKHRRSCYFVCGKSIRGRQQMNPPLSHFFPANHSSPASPLSDVCRWLRQIELRLELADPLRSSSLERSSSFVSGKASVCLSFSVYQSQRADLASAVCRSSLEGKGPVDFVCMEEMLRCESSAACWCLSSPGISSPRSRQSHTAKVLASTEDAMVDPLYAELSSAGLTGQRRHRLCSSDSSYPRSILLSLPSTFIPVYDLLHSPA